MRSIISETADMWTFVEGDEEGATLARITEFDLIVIDCSTRESKDGLALCRRLHGDVATAETMILAICPTTAEIHETTWLEAGAIRVLIAPQNDDEIAGLRGNLQAFLRMRRHLRHELSVQAEVQNREKSDFVQTFAMGIAHNFNNLLTAGLGFLHLAREGMTDKRRLGHLRNLELVQERMCELARQLIMLAGDHGTTARPVKLRRVIVGALALFDAAALKKHVALLCDVGRLHSVLVHADDFQLTQAILQVLYNAREAIEHEEGRIRIHGKIEGDCAVVEISDNGCGMDDDMLARIKDPFFTTKEEVGVGLGLSSIDRVIRDLGGRLDVKSELGDGTRVIFRLPICEEESEEDVQHDEQVCRSGIRLLLAVDANETRRALEAILVVQEANVELVDSPSELFEALKGSSPYDAIILDLLRSREFGQDLIDHLRESTALPIVYLYSTPAEAPEEAAGVVLLRKPFGADELIRALGAFPHLMREQQ